MASPKAYTPKNGFTLIEIMIVMGILVIVGGLGLAMSMESYRGSSIRDERDLIVSVLQTARSQAINNICMGSTCSGGKPHGVRVNAGTYVIYQTENGSTTANAWSNHNIPANNDSAYDQTIKSNYNTVKLNGTNNDIIFENLSGDVIKNRNINVSDAAQDYLTITISDQGQIDWSQVKHY